MAQKNLSFKKGTTARAARGKVAEELKGKGDPPDKAFAIATAITQRTKTPAATKRLAKHGLRTAKKG